MYCLWGARDHSRARQWGARDHRGASRHSNSQREASKVQHRISMFCWFTIYGIRCRDEYYPTSSGMVTVTMYT